MCCGNLKVSSGLTKGLRDEQVGHLRVSWAVTELSRVPWVQETARADSQEPSGKGEPSRLQHDGGGQVARSAYSLWTPFRCAQPSA